MDFREVKEFLMDSAKFIIMLIILIIIFFYVISFQKIIGTSMSPTLKDSDLIILCNFKYKIFDVKREDVISFKDKDDKRLIKRVIGLPGERIAIHDNILYINDEEYEETYLTDDTQTEEYILNDNSKIPDDMYFVLGDNRENSSDSREFGLIKKEDIVGQACLRLLPASSFGFVK